MIINLVYSSLVYIGWLKKVAFFFWNAIEFQAPQPPHNTHTRVQNCPSYNFIYLQLRFEIIFLSHMKGTLVQFPVYSQKV